MDSVNLHGFAGIFSANQLAVKTSVAASLIDSGRSRVMFIKVFFHNFKVA